MRLLQGSLPSLSWSWSRCCFYFHTSDIEDDNQYSCGVTVEIWERRNSAVTVKVFGKSEAGGRFAIMQWFIYNSSGNRIIKGSWTQDDHFIWQQVDPAEASSGAWLGFPKVMLGWIQHGPHWSFIRKIRNITPVVTKLKELCSGSHHANTDEDMLALYLSVSSMGRTCILHLQ